MNTVLNKLFKIFPSESLRIKPVCEHPKFVFGVGWVRCGHCPLCLEKAKKEWITRLNCEMRTARTGVFLTLTFDDEHIGNTSYFEIQKFIRRYKHFFKLDGKGIKYFGCFEKGDLTNRAHYHILIFGHNPKLVWTNHFLCNEKLAKIWKKGLVKAEWLNDKSIKYVAQYVSKKLYVKQLKTTNLLVKQLNKYTRNDIEFMIECKKMTNLICEEKETFIFESKSIGFKYLFKNLKRILEQNVIRLGSKSYPIPKGFLDKLRKFDNTAVIQFIDNRRFDYLFKFDDLLYNCESLDEQIYIENGINECIQNKVIDKMISYNKRQRIKEDIDRVRSIRAIPF